MAHLPLTNPTNILCPLLRPLIPLFHYRFGSKTGGWRTRGSVTVWTGLTHWIQTCVPSWWVRQLLDSPTHCYPACPFICTLIWAWVASQAIQIPTVPPQGQWTLCTSLPRPTPGSVDFHSRLSIPLSRHCTIPQDATVPIACTGDQTTWWNIEGELEQLRSPKPLAVLQDRRKVVSLPCWKQFTQRYTPSCCSKPVWLFFFLWSTKEYILNFVFHPYYERLRLLYLCICTVIPNLAILLFFFL